MSFDIATASPIVLTIDGTPTNLKPLTRGQCGELLAKWAAEDRTRLIAMLDDSHLDGKERLEELRKQDRDGRLAAYAYRCLFDFDRSSETIALALGAEPPAGIAPDLGVEIACALWGRDYNRMVGGTKDEKADGDDSQGGADPTSATKIG